MNELLREITETTQNVDKIATKKNTKAKGTEVIFDFDGLKYAAAKDTFENDYDLFYTFIISYGGKNIEDYKQPKERNGKEYKAAHFPEQDKTNMLRSLEKIMDIKTERINAKVTQYVILSVNQAAIDFEMEKMLYKAKKSA